MKEDSLGFFGLSFGVNGSLRLLFGVAPLFCFQRDCRAVRVLLRAEVGFFETLWDSMESFNAVAVAEKSESAAS